VAFLVSVGGLLGIYFAVSELPAAAKDYRSTELPPKPVAAIVGVGVYVARVRRDLLKPQPQALVVWLVGVALVLGALNYVLILITVNWGLDPDKTPKGFGLAFGLAALGFTAVDWIVRRCGFGWELALTGIQAVSVVTIAELAPISEGNGVLSGVAVAAALELMGFVTNFGISWATVRRAPVKPSLVPCRPFGPGGTFGPPAA
jgi:hypothetical protein